MTLTVPFHGLIIECHYEPGRKRDPLPTDVDDEPEVFSIQGGVMIEDAPENAPPRTLRRCIATLNQEFVAWLDKNYRDDIYDLAMAERSRARG